MKTAAMIGETLHVLFILFFPPIPAKTFNVMPVKRHIPEFFQISRCCLLRGSSDKNSDLMISSKVGKAVPLMKARVHYCLTEQIPFGAAWREFTAFFLKIRNTLAF